MRWCEVINREPMVEEVIKRKLVGRSSKKGSS